MVALRPSPNETVSATTLANCKPSPMNHSTVPAITTGNSGQIARVSALKQIAAMARLAFLRRLDSTALTREIEAQLAAFAAAFGRAPDFLDGHQHVHLFPQIREETLAAVKRAAPAAWVRQCGSALPLRILLRDFKTLALSELSRGFRRRAAARGVATNPAFAGVYDLDPDTDFAALFPRFLEGLPENGLVMCHPGHVDAELKRLDPLTDLRESEYRYFAGDAFPRALAAAGVGLV